MQANRHFADLVPLRQDKERLYNHLFRALYATIAAHWYCPSTVLEHNYKAEIQGHFTISADRKKVPNYSARSHYDDYLIGYFDSESQSMQRDGRLGIKLQVEGVQVIEAFRQGQSVVTNLHQEPPAKLKTKGDILTPNRHPILVTDYSQEDVPLWQELTSPKDSSRAANSNPEIELVQIMTQAQSPLVEDLDQHTTEDIKVSDMTTGRSTKQGKAKSDRSKADISPQLSTTTETPALNTAGSEPKSASTRKQQQKSLHSNKEKTKRPDLEADDLDRMRQIMAQFGIVGSSSEVFAALLDRFEQLQQVQQQPPVLHQDLETIRWFTREIDSLRSQISAIEQEKDQLKVSAAQLDEIAQLGAENVQLKMQLQQNQAVLDNLRSSLAQVGLIGVGEALTSPESAATMPLSDTSQKTPKLSHTSATPANTNGSLATTDAEIASATLPSTPSKPSKKTRSGAEQTAAKIHLILDALIAWNSAHTLPHQRIRIGILPVKALASKMRADYQAQIQAALQQRREEIEQMHQSLLLGSKHNRTLSNKDELLQAIARDYLYLANWHDVRYPA